jgi:hypothetical protein
MVPSQGSSPQGPARRSNVKGDFEMRKPLVLLSVLGLAGALYAADSFSGTWKLNLAKSKYEPGPAPKETIVTVVEGKSLTDVTVTGTDENGKPIATHMTHPTDGGAVKFVEGAPTDGSTESVKQLNANTREITIMQGGKVVATEHITVSADGKTMQIVAKGTSPSGKPFANVEVFEKQ